MIEIGVGPREESVGVELDESLHWSAFIEDLRSLLAALTKSLSVTRFEITDLFVGEPPEESFIGLRNGSVLDAGEAIEFVVRMAGGRGPYCALTAPGIRIESSWDASTYLLLDSVDSLQRLPPSLPHLCLDYSDVPASEGDTGPRVDTVANEGFWRDVAESTAGVKLLCERWAYGVHGARWYRLNEGSTRLIVPPIQPRSMLSVLLDPETALSGIDIGEGFIALGSFGEAGLIAHEEYPFGVDSIGEVVERGWKHAVSESATWAWVAVVPDADGIPRGAWELFDH